MIEYVSSLLKTYHSEHILPEKFSDIPAEDGVVLTRLLKPIIEHQGVVDRIHLYETDYASKFVLGMIQRRTEMTGMYSGDQDVAHIYFQKRLNTCWRRFVVCKEMYHCMIDRTEDSRVASLGFLHRLMEALSEDTSAVLGVFKPLKSEEAAEILALETLAPVEYRLQLVDDYRSGAISANEVAEIFKIPEDFVDFSFQRHYLEAMSSLRKPLLF